MDSERFITKTIISGALYGSYIVVDKETGVQYICYNTLHGASMTPLIGPDGKPIIDPKYAK